MVDESEDARASGRVALRHGVVEVVRRRDRLPGLGDVVGELLATIRPRRGLIGSLRGDSAERRLPGADQLCLLPDELRDVAEGSIIRSGTEENDVFAGLAGVLARISRIWEHGGRAGNVGAGQEEDALVGRVGGETDEDAAAAFVLRRVVGRNGETTERWGEGLAQLGDALQLGERVEAHELGLAAAVDGLDEGDLSVGEPGFLECG